MGGDDLNTGEKMKWGEEPPSPGLCPKGGASVPLIQPLGWGHGAAAAPWECHGIKTPFKLLCSQEIPTRSRLSPAWSQFLALMPWMVPFTLSPSL